MLAELAQVDLLAHDLLPMIDEGVHNARHCEHASHNCANARHEVQEGALPFLLVHLGIGEAQLDVCAQQASMRLLLRLQAMNFCTVP